VRGTEHDVLGLEVAMHDRVLGHALQTSEETFHYLSDLFLSEFSILFLDNFIQVLSL
jgi:hypothetical protein